MDTLQVGAKLATGDAGDFRAHPAKVFGFTSMGDLIAQSGLLSTNFTCLSHSRHSPLGQSCRHGDKRSNIPAGPGDARGLLIRGKAERGRRKLTDIAVFSAPFAPRHSFRILSFPPSTFRLPPLIRFALVSVVLPRYYTEVRCPLKRPITFPNPPAYKRFIDDLSDHLTRASASLPLVSRSRPACRSLPCCLGRSDGSQPQRPPYRQDGFVSG